MVWFSKKEKKEDIRLPSLPELPKLPELPEIGNDFGRPISSQKKETLGKLPSIPISSLGEKFSQNLIKDAVNGKKEDKEVLDADEFENLEDEEEQMMQKPLKTFPSQIQSPMTNNTKRADTVFIRIDKFEESLNIFKGSQKKISEIEEILTEVKKVKEKEEREITDWENEIQNIKKQFEKIDRNIFSKIE